MEPRSVSSCTSAPTSSAMVGAFSKAVRVGLFALLTALLARLCVHLPFTPVPATGQTLGVMLAAGLLGSREGLASVAAYVLAGLAGLPVFAMGGGPLYLLGPTGGYLAGFVAAAWLGGRMSDAGFRSGLPRCLIMMLLMSAVIHLLGASWLAVHVGPGRALGAGVLPFVPGDLLKAATAAVAVRATEGARSLLRR